MGQEKEAMIVREERARARAKDDGQVCVCGEPLLTEKEQSDGLCVHCKEEIEKDD